MGFLIPLGGKFRFRPGNMVLPVAAGEAEHGKDMTVFRRFGENLPRFEQILVDAFAKQVRIADVKVPGAVSQIRRLLKQCECELRIFFDPPASKMQAPEFDQRRWVCRIEFQRPGKVFARRHRQILGNIGVSAQVIGPGPLTLVESRRDQSRPEVGAGKAELLCLYEFHRLCNVCPCVQAERGEGLTQQPQRTQYSSRTTHTTL